MNKIPHFKKRLCLERLHGNIPPRTGGRCDSYSHIAHELDIPCI